FSMDSNMSNSESDMSSSELDKSSSESDMSSNESDTLSSSSQSTIMEEVGLQSEVTQTIVDSGINFQPLSGEYDLMCIIEHPNFRSEHIIKNIRRLRSLRRRLPLQTIKCHQVLIQNIKTPSTSTPFKNSYTISISKHIRRVLGNRSLRSQIYFGPGIEAETKSEFWHRNIWQESPLFSPSSIRIDN
ncbi:10597_t:CDS:2, partial [Gigaspora margarita]